MTVTASLTQEIILLSSEGETGIQTGSIANEACLQTGAQAENDVGPPGCLHGPLPVQRLLQAPALSEVNDGVSEFCATAAAAATSGVAVQ